MCFPCQILTIRNSARWVGKGTWFSCICRCEICIHRLINQDVLFSKKKIIINQEEQFPQCRNDFVFSNWRRQNVRKHKNKVHHYKWWDLTNINKLPLSCFNNLRTIALRVELWLQTSKIKTEEMLTFKLQINLFKSYGT